MIRFSVPVLALLACGLVLAAGLSGRYVMNTSNGTFQLTLQEQGGGTLTGELVGSTGFRVRLEGQIQDGVGVGVARGDNVAVFFELYPLGNGVGLDLIEPDARNMPDYNKTRHLEFQQTAESGTSTPPAAKMGDNPLSGANPAATRQSNPLARGHTDPFSGSYRGDGLALTLNGGNGSYTGSLTFQGQPFPVTATGSGNNLKGSFTASGQSFPFTAQFNGTMLTFQTGGTSYALKKSGGVPSTTPRNPLQKGGSARGTSDRAPAGASAAPTRAGGGQVLNDPQSGMFITVPAGWQARQTPGGYLMGSNQYPGLILITEHYYRSLEQMTQASGEGFEDDNSQLMLRPSGQVSRISDRAVGVEMSGTVQGTPARAYVAGVLSPKGGGILIIAMTSTKAYSDQHREFAQQIARSARFDAATEPTGLMQWFAGRYYHFSGSSGGGSSFSHESRQVFCPNGVYRGSYEAGGSGSSADMSGNETMTYGTVGNQHEAAQWQIRGTRERGVITIIYPNGDSRDISYQATGKGQDMRLDGELYSYEGRATCP